MENVIKYPFMNKHGYSIVALVTLLILVNIPACRLFRGGDDCQYSNASGSFTFGETNIEGYDYHLCVNRFNDFKKKNNNDTILFRLTPMNLLCFWKYGEYIFDNKYHLPFKSWQSIENIRGTITNKTGYQDF